MCHISSLELMVKNCSFNEYHHDFTKVLEPSLLDLSVRQSTIITSLIAPSSITKYEYSQQINDLQQAFSKLRSAYIDVRLRRVEYVLQSAKTIQSEDSLSHAYFLFHVEAIIRILTELALNNEDKAKSVHTSGYKKKMMNCKPEWSRILSSIKSIIIIGVGSLFVLIPSLSKTFENGHLILITLCVTQGDTVGGALTTMKMRLIGTLIGKIIL